MVRIAGDFLVLLLVGVVIFTLMFGFFSATDSPTAKLYPMTGVIVEVDPAKQWVVLDHEDIHGLMKAMRMKFAVGEPKVLEGKRVGDKIRCRLKVTEDGQYVLLLPSGLKKKKG